ncbi:hypothetical protein BS47DRAFT_1403188 [Hydnum rufescens UP504]|uniref:Uncharacterized protein n=1 Tax=Hydnum rufescens UP504 TaxID=1448309 RepID=A0A9P6ACR5_9AGAM|nr:hypothetical protein BS47DRAFT_1403188 [Hydnum rufescens UP504]
MAPKRKLFEVTPSQDLHDYFLITKIPNHPKSNTFVNDILSGVDDLKTVISRGLDYNTTSLAFRVPDKDSEHISKTLVGNHKNHNKKGICTTLVKAAFHNEVALESAGFRSFPDRLMPWVGFTMFNKCTYSSAGLVPQWWKGFRPSKKDWELIKRIAADWDANPRPKQSLRHPKPFPQPRQRVPQSVQGMNVLPNVLASIHRQILGALLREINHIPSCCHHHCSLLASSSFPLHLHLRLRLRLIFILAPSLSPPSSSLSLSSSHLHPCPLFVPALFIFVFVSSSSLITTIFPSYNT